MKIKREEMKNKEIDKAIRNGEIIVTTKDIIREAVKQAVSSLYDDVSDFSNNRYMTGSDRSFEQLSDQQQNDVADEVIDYLID